MDEIATPAPSKHKLIPLRIAIYALLLCGGLGWAYTLPIDPYRDFRTVVDAADDSQGEEVRFHEGGAFLYMLPKEGYVLTLAVHVDRERFPKASFFTVVGGEDGEPIKCSKMLPSELGHSKDVVYEGDEMLAILKDVELDLAPLKKTYRDHYR